jgi:hypothetical protein
MDFFVTATMIKTDGAEAYRAEETRTLNELRAAGVVSVAYLRTDGAGLIGVVHGTDLAAVKANLGRLPFVTHGFMAFEYAEIVPL